MNRNTTNQVVVTRASVVNQFLSKSTRTSHPSRPEQRLLWAVLPPIWFWLEYFYVYRVYGLPDTLELFKYGQDVAKAIWAGVLTGLIAFAASDATKAAPQKAPKGKR